MYTAIKRYCDQNPQKATYWEFALVGLLSAMIGGFAMMHLAALVLDATGYRTLLVPGIFGATFSVLMIQLYNAMRLSDLKKLQLSPERAKAVEVTATISNLFACFFACVIVAVFAAF